MLGLIPLTPFHPIWDGVSIDIRHWHFHRRLYERYSIILRPGEFADIFEKAVKKKKKAFHKTDRSRVHSVFVRSAQEMVFVVADERSLITVLTPAMAHAKARACGPKRSG